MRELQEYTALFFNTCTHAYWSIERILFP